MSQKALEALQREHPVSLNERRGRKLEDANSHQTDPTQAVLTHQSLAVMEDADEETVIRQIESAQGFIGKFFQLIKSGEIEHYLSEYTPAAQAHLIEEIKIGITLLEEFVIKDKTIEVNSID